MSELEHDPETDAIEGQLNAAFASARPRPEFEDELWVRIRAGAGLGVRLREAWTSLNRGPLVASGVGLAALVLVALIAFVSLRVGGSGAPTATTAGGSRSSSYVPAPALKATSGQAAAADAQAPAVTPYYGPADLSWSGVLPTLPTTAPVLAFKPLSPDELAAFTAQTALGPPYAFTLELTGPEPRYVISNGSQNDLTAGIAPTDQQAKQAADAFIADHKLAPTWPADVVVSRTAQGAVSVQYFRRFPVSGAAPAVEIDESGSRAGISFLIGPGPTVIQAQGPVPVSTQSSTYPLRQPEAMVAAALAAQPASAQSVGTTVPKVALSRATLVYIAVRPGYYEPALLFTGSFTIGNQIYEKRVLVPAIDPSRLQP